MSLSVAPAVAAGSWRRDGHSVCLRSFKRATFFPFNSSVIVKAAAKSHSEARLKRRTYARLLYPSARDAMPRWPRAHLPALRAIIGITS